MKKSLFKAVHLTSVHSRYDVRILLKECITLANAGNNVFLLVADGMGDELYQNLVSILDVGKPKNRQDRILSTSKKIYAKAHAIDADIYHIHDPELLSVGLKLKKAGKKVIYDAHEDFPKDILTKHYIPTVVRKPMSFFSYHYERYIAKKLDGVVAATSFIKEKFLSYGINTIDVNNYPKLNEFSSIDNDWQKKQNYACYVGGLANVRGIREIVDAMSFTTTNSRLYLAGNFIENDLEEYVKKSDGWEKVDELGWLNRKDILKTLESSKVGLVTLYPTITYLDALPVKMFEYMGAGIPVIASNFPLWKEIIDDNQCGLCVDPLDSREIAKAIDYIISHHFESKQMGENGRQAILTKFNWEIEEQKLLLFYQQIIGF